MKIPTDEDFNDEGKDSTKAPEIKVLTGDEEIAAMQNTFRWLQLKVAATHPYFSTIIYNGLQYVISDKLPTFAVDAKMRLYYNPGMFDVCKVDELAGALVHEIHHVLRNDCERFKGYEYPQLTNVASDLVINQHIIKEENKKVSLPKFACLPTSPEINLPPDQTADWYYQELVKKAKKQEKESGKKGKGEGSGDPSNSSGDAKPTGGSCGSCAGGDSPKPWEEGTSDNPLPEGRSDIQKEYYKKITAEAIKARMRTNPGDVPGELSRWAEEILNPKIDWKRELRATVLNDISRVASGLSDYSYRRMSRRQNSGQLRGIILPGFQTYDPTIGVILDTSGSMSESMISQALAEVNSVLSNTNATVIFVSCDAAVFSIGPIRNKHELKNKVGGGGGTDMRVAYKAIEDSKWKPQLIICLTDGYTPWDPEPIKGTKNIICITSPKNDKGYGDCPSWAKVIRVESD
jgi:predicted metal-dependent peptidase